MTPVIQSFLHSCLNGPVEVSGRKAPTLVYNIVMGCPDIQIDPTYKLANIRAKSFLSREEDTIILQIFDGDELVFMNEARPSDSARPVSGPLAQA